ncbi:MAG: hypothetical protein HUU02_06905 [Bacteroidetes bacterium]|nr:hypothetical protein [Bacteroidota bacterium]
MNIRTILAALVIGMLSTASAEGNKYLTVIPVITEADIINASVLVDPMAEKLKVIAPTTFSLTFQNLAGAAVKASMQFTATVTLEEDKRTESMFNGPAQTRKPFLIPVSGRVFTSTDADNPSSDIDMSVSVNEALKTKLKDKILEPLSGGRVPSGLYEITITITVDSVGGVAVSDIPIQIYRSVNVTNPTTTVLDVPFSNGYVYPTQFPQFQWTYDTRAVMITVYEKRPEHQSLEDATAASDPFLRVRIDRRLSGNMTSFAYPQSAASRPGVEFLRGPRQLERGKMYVIVLEGIVSAFGFEVEPLRTVRSFTIADPQGQVLITLLQTTFGGSEYQNIINFIQDQNLQVNANGITLNGVTLSSQDLQKLLMEYKDRITSVRFEE